MVAGRVLVRDGEVPTADKAAVRAEAQAQAEKVAARGCRSGARGCGIVGRNGGRPAGRKGDL